MSLSTNRPGRCDQCQSVLVYSVADNCFVCTNARCGGVEQETKASTPMRCTSCNSFMAHDLANNRIFCANPMCVQSNCEGQSRVEGTLWCPDCNRPFPRGSNHECAPKGVPSEAECRAADERPKFASWPCHRTQGNQCIHADCFDKLPKEEEKVVTGNFGGDPYKLNGELAEKIGRIIDSYQGRISLAAVMGVLEITKINLWSKHNG